MSLPNGAVFANGIVLTNGASLANGAYLPNGGTGMVGATTKPTNSSFPANTELYSGAILGRGAIITNGASFPNGGVLPNGASFPNGMTLPNGTFLPNGTVLPNGTFLPNGTVLPNGTPVPSSACTNGVCNNGINIAQGTIAPPSNSELDLFLRDPAKFKVVQYILQCAMTSSQTVAITAGGVTTQVAGAVGLAANYRNTRILDEADQEWVSACLLARVNQKGTSVTIDMRGNRPDISMNYPNPMYVKFDSVVFGNIFTNPPKIFAYTGSRTLGGAGSSLINSRFCNNSYSCEPFVYDSRDPNQFPGDVWCLLNSALYALSPAPFVPSMNSLGYPVTCGYTANGSVKYETKRVIATGVNTCIPKVCASYGPKVCGSVGDDCGQTLNCGGCADGSVCSSKNQCGEVVVSVRLAASVTDEVFVLTPDKVKQVRSPNGVTVDEYEGSMITTSSGELILRQGQTYRLTTRRQTTAHKRLFNWSGACTATQSASCTFTAPAAGSASITLSNVTSTTVGQLDGEVCASAGRECGTHTAVDNGGVLHAIKECASARGISECSYPLLCGTQQPGVCDGCAAVPPVAAICGERNCGSYTVDHCGRPVTVNCGYCSNGQVCGAAGTANKCANAALISTYTLGNTTGSGVIAGGDAYVSGGSTNTNTNYGTATTLSVNGTTTNPQWGFIRIDAGCTAANPCTSIKLRLYILTGTVSSAVQVSVPNTAFTETTVNWNNKPALGVSRNPISGDAGTWAEMELLTVPSSSGTQVVSLVPANFTTNHVFATKEHATAAYRPQVIITRQF